MREMSRSAYARGRFASHTDDRFRRYSKGPPVQMVGPCGPNEQSELSPMLMSYEFASAWLQSRCKTDRGASLVEYALLVALIALVCILAVTFLGKQASSKFSSVGSGIK